MIDIKPGTVVAVSGFAIERVRWVCQSVAAEALRVGGAVQWLTQAWGERELNRIRLDTWGMVHGLNHVSERTEADLRELGKWDVMAEAFHDQNSPMDARRPLGIWSKVDPFNGRAKYPWVLSLYKSMETEATPTVIVVESAQMLGWDAQPDMIEDTLHRIADKRNCMVLATCDGPTQLTGVDQFEIQRAQIIDRDDSWLYSWSKVLGIQRVTREKFL